MKEEGVILIATFGTLITLFVSVSVFVFFIYYQKRKFLYAREKLQLQQEHLQAAIEIQEQTFQTISQEIHDNIGQLLSLAKLNLNTTDTTQPEDTKEKIEQSKELISKSITALRNLSKSLSAEVIKDIGLSESIQRELLLLSGSGKFNTSYSEKGKSYRLDTQKELVLFRIFQEAITNIIKHSGARVVAISLKYEPEAFEMMISDDGVGFNTDSLVPVGAKQEGLGIRNMQNRAKLIGAQFYLSSKMGKGTVITILLSEAALAI